MIKMVSVKRKIIIRGCAERAVELARMEIWRLLKSHGLEPHQVSRDVMAVLYQAQHNAGKWAVEAAETDTRTYNDIRDITGI